MKLKSAPVLASIVLFLCSACSGGSDGSAETTGSPDGTNADNTPGGKGDHFGSPTCPARNDSPSIVLVSDIDDTIKRTDVLGHLEGALGTTNEFAGMEFLYRDWHKTDPIGREISYLSAAPGVAVTAGLDFLRGSGFPADTEGDIACSVISGDGSLPAGEFKGNELVEAYDAAPTKPSTIILVGDNGEQDMVAYARLIQHVADSGESTKVFSYIHHVYETNSRSTPITEPHVQFLTSADLAVHFYNNEWIDEQALEDAVMEVWADSIPNPTDPMKLNEWAKPDYMECSGFDAWPSLEREASPWLVDTYADIITNMKTLCGGN